MTEELGTALPQDSLGLGSRRPYLPWHNSPGGVRLTALDQSIDRTGDKQQRTQYRTKSDMFGLPNDHRDTSTDYGRPPDKTVAVARDLSNLETSVQEVRAPRPDPPAAAEATTTSVTLVSEVGSGVIDAKAHVSEVEDLDARRPWVLSGDGVLSSDTPIFGAAFVDDVN